MKKLRCLSLSLLIGLGTVSVGVAPAVLGQFKAVSETVSTKNAYNENIYKKCKEAVDLIDLNIDEDSVVADLLLPVNSVYETTFTWVSSDTTVIAMSAITNDNGNITGYRGVVTRDATEDKKATITVTAVIGDNTDSTATRSFELTVLKQSESSTSTLPLAMTESFTDYEVGVDISNYSIWSQEVGEAQISQVISEADFPNELVSSRALKITSGRLTSNVRYDRKLNIARSESSVNVLSGYYLFTGETNEVDIELASSGTVIGGFGFTHEGIKQFISKGYSDLSSDFADEGVWIRWRYVFRHSGYSYLQVWDWSSGAYKTLDSVSGFRTAAGVSYGYASGNSTTGTIDSIRIAVKKGTKVGATYLSDLTLDTLTNLPEETTITNPNRSDGLGNIEGYEETILAYYGSQTSSIDPTTFSVYNRFDKTELYTLGTDYTVSTKTEEENSGAVVHYSHLFTLTSTGETKTITQTVYYDQESSPAYFEDYSVSYLKTESSSSTNAYLTISGKVIRSDITIHYLILEKGSAAPSVTDVLSPATSLSGYAASGSQAIEDREFSFDTSAVLNINSEYDAYLVGSNANGNTELLSITSISDVVNITTCEEFFDMTVNLDTTESTFRLMNDLDFSNFNWDYVASNSIQFKGSLDGQGYTISNLNINTTDSKVGLFYRCDGTIENLTFKNCNIYGAENVGIIAGNVYGGTYRNLNFIDCNVGIEETCTGGEGYFGIFAGRCRGDGKTLDLDNINIKDCSISCPKYVGLLTGGLESGVTTTINQIYAEGDIETEGAAVGLIGRNRGSTTIDDGICLLDITEAKKEVAIVAGHNKEGGSLNVSNFFGDLKVRSITQPNYIGQFIGSHDAGTSSYSIDSFWYVNEDYSDLSDSIVPDSATVSVGNVVSSMPSSIEAWEQSSFIRDFNTNLTWQFDESSALPYLSPRDSSELNLTAALFEEYVGKLTEKVSENHYYLYKAGNVYANLSETELAKVDADVYATYEARLAEYKAMSEEIEGSLDGLGYRG